MSQYLKTRRDVQIILRAVILECLTNRGYTGFECLEFGQAAFVNANKFVAMNHVSSRRVGFQGFKFYTDENGNPVREDTWIDEQTWQLSVICRENKEHIYGEDIVEALAAWLNGPGAETLLNEKIGILRIDDSNINAYVDDSDADQKRAVLTIQLQVPKVMITPTSKISEFNAGIVPV